MSATAAHAVCAPALRRATASAAATLSAATVAVGVLADVTREVEVQVVAMGAVALGADHRGEALAGAAVDGAQEPSLLHSAPPAALDGDAAAVGEGKGRDVEGIGESVLRERPLARAVAAAAGVGAGDADLHHRLPEVLQGGRLHRLGEPPLRRHDHRAVEGGRRRERDAPAERRRHHEGAVGAADAGTVHGPARPDEGRRLDEAGAHARRRGLRAPGFARLPTAKAEESAPGQRN